MTTRGDARCLRTPSWLTRSLTISRQYIFLNSSMYRPNNIIPINFDAIWTSYPKLGLSATHKAYYLTQAAL